MTTIYRVFRRLAAGGATLALLLGAPLSVPVAAAPVAPAPAALAQVAPVTFHDCADCPEMVAIPAGSIDIGSTPEERSNAGTPAMFGDREGPVVKVTIARPYALGRTEVTRKMYAAFIADTRRVDPAGCGIHDAAKDSWSPQPGYNWHNPGFAQGDDHPVVCVSFDDAAAYAAWLSHKTGKRYTLPSEVQWEYAARGGTRTAWYWGDAMETGCDKANILSSGMVAAFGSPNSMAGRVVCNAAHTFTTPVASYAPNPFGLYDMIGNAFEWVADCYADSHVATPTDGSANVQSGCTRHFLKGGAFHTPLWLTRSAVRGNPIPADLHMFTIGFRVARVID